jgi:hypothetical protein
MPEISIIPKKENPLYTIGFPIQAYIPKPDYTNPSEKALEYRIGTDLYKETIFRFLPEAKNYKGITYRPASQEDLGDVFRIRKEAFEGSGLKGENFDTDKYDFFSQIFVAERDGKVVGTVRTVHDSYLGLPLEKDYNIIGWRNSLPKIGEIGRLALDESVRGTPCVFGLLNMLYEYAGLNSITDYFASARPHHAKAYRCVNMAIIDDEAHHNSSVNVISNLLRWEISSVNTRFISRMLGAQEKLS